MKLWVILCCATIVQSCSRTNDDNDVISGRKDDQVKEQTLDINSHKVISALRKHNPVTETIQVHRDGRYIYNGSIRLIKQDSGVLWHQINVQISILYKGDVYPEVTTIGTLPHLRKELGWVGVGGDFQVKDRELENATLQITVDSTSASFELQNASLAEVKADPQWKEKADQRIDQLRKNNITVRFNISKELDPSKAMVMLNQTKRDFPFGSMVSADIMTDTKRKTSEKYRDFFYNLFEFTVLGNALKWQDMERELNKIDFTHADNALAVLAEKGIPVRGHCILWDVERHEPKWLLPMNRSDVIAQVQRRMKYVIGHYKGKLPHWDVNNEQLHGNFFETKTGDPDYLTKAFQMAHQVDPNVKLFTNDYNVVAASGFTQAYVNLVNRLKATGAPISRIGTQNHFMSVPDVTLVQYRLNLLATTGLPIWVTELDISITNQDDKAESYENVLRTYFAHPGVEGVMFWGFWDEDHWRPRAAIVEGDDFKLNKAGKAITRLLKEEWVTRAVMHPTDYNDVMTVRGFHGNYDVTLYYDGRVVRTSQVYLHKGKDLAISINITLN